MPNACRTIALFCIGLSCALPSLGAPSARYKALRSVLVQSPAPPGTWAILDRDGAHRKVTPYLSSLGGGEMGTGVIRSPAFPVTGDRIEFTICGHDGRGGGRNRNLIALLDAETGGVLRKTLAPATDAMQPRAWNVGDLKGRRVRIEVRDGIADSAFAWLGIGRIRGGGGPTVDFSRGMPSGWKATPGAKQEPVLVPGGVPFLAVTRYTVFPAHGAAAFPCGFAARRLFLLGCTVTDGRPLEVYGVVELRYRDGTIDRIPLVYGFTLDGEAKLRSPSPALYLHVSGDPFRYYLILRPRSKVIEQIRFEANPSHDVVPGIAAITCETDATGPNLGPLPDMRPGPEEAQWIANHAVTPGEPDRAAIMEAIRRAHKLPPLRAHRGGERAGSGIRFRKIVIDPAFRSEGVAVADFNRDGHQDIAAGAVYYEGPDWRPRPMRGEVPSFPRKGYSDAFLCFADDVNRDGWIDLIVVGFPGAETTWLENPGKAGGTWRRYRALDHTGNESPWYGDLDGDGRGELVFVAGDRVALARPGEDPRAPWRVMPIAAPGQPHVGHGLGVGDLNGDGRPDVLLPVGWWEQPEGRGATPWPFHPARFSGGAQLCVYDADGDGDADVLGSSAHGYGIWWCRKDADGWATFVVGNEFSQTHALHLADLDGDGLLDLVTGKRYLAHNGGDPGSGEPALLCWFRLERRDGSPRWTKYVIDTASGVGLHVAVADVNGDGRLDIVTANKKGVYCFQQVGRGKGT